MKRVNIPIPAKQTLGQKIVTKIVVVGLLLSMLGVGLLVYWGSASTEVFQINKNPIPVRTIREHPTADGVVILDVDLCKKTSAKGQTRVSFVSASREIFLPLSDENLPEGCLDREIPILIPHEITPGEYKIKFRVEYDLNPLKKNVIQEFESLTFIVDEESNVTLPEQVR